MLIQLLTVFTDPELRATMHSVTDRRADGRHDGASSR